MRYGLKESRSSLNEVFIGLGANIGPVRENLIRAVKGIKKFAILIVASSLYESAPIGPQNQPNFTNAVVKIGTELSPFELLARLKELEKQIGRQKTKRWGPREIDLDILFYEDLVIDTRLLVIPHPQAHKRRFVLEPILEIDPHARHPSKSRKLRDIYLELGNTHPVYRTQGPELWANF